MEKLDSKDNDNKMENNDSIQNTNTYDLESELNILNINDTVKINSDNNLSKKSEFKEKKKSDKKLSKKLTKAIKVILFHEGPQEKIFSIEPTTNVWIYHFGNGDENDQNSIKEYFNKNFGECKVFMFPGISYGFLEFKEKSIAIKVLNDDSQPSVKIKHAGHEIKFPNGERTVFTFYSNLPLAEVQQNKNTTGTFPVASYKANVPGLYIIDDFLTEEEESQMINSIDSQQWNKLTNRRVQHYGYEFIYGANNVNKKKKIGDLPNFCGGVLKKIEEILGKFCLKSDLEQTKIKNFEFNEDLGSKNPSFYEMFGNFDQLTINDYSPGEGIPPHVDSHSPFEDVFCSLSLGSGSVMTFTSPKNEQQHVYLKPRSLVIFSGDVRFIWQHSISLRKLDRVEDDIFFRKRRISLTFRKIRKGECSCPYIEFCDSQKNAQTVAFPTQDSGIKIDSSSSSQGLPTEVEKKHVYDVYEKIAPHFSHTRYKPWPKVSEYLNSLPAGSFSADVGCGNGKYLNVNDNIFSFGTDRSFNLISICKEKSKNNQLFVADSLRLPIRSETFDSVISIAVVHHFSTVELRLKAIKELIRILRVKGTLLIYVWAMEQEEKKFTQQDNFVPWHLQDTYENDNKLTSLGPEIIKEEKKNATVYHRYYHVFVKGELEELLKLIENISILESYYDHANWCCIVRKEF